MTQTTPEQRQRLRELLSKVTPEGWDVGDYEEKGTVFVFGPDGDGVCEVWGNIALDDGYDAKDVAQFIAESRSAVPALLADLDAAEAEIERMKEEAVELHETILLAEGFHIRDGEMVGWIDSCCMADAVISGDRLVELGIYERHPNRAGRRSFYRRKDVPARTALENMP